jgi:hypothetical protein
MNHLSAYGHGMKNLALLKSGLLSRLTFHDPDGGIISFLVPFEVAPRFANPS